MRIQTLNKTDKPTLADLFPSARIKVLPNSLRLVFPDDLTDTARDAYARTLNVHGYRNCAGGEYSARSFNGYREIFVHAKIMLDGK